MAETSALQDLGRAREIVGVLARHGFGQFLSGLPLKKFPGLKGMQSQGKMGEQLPAGRRMVRVMEELGPTFVKLGQMLSTRSDAFPSEVCAEFASLQDQVNPVSWEDARRVIESELGHPPETLFEHIEETPIASASIAQVHRARLETGESVAVKIQRPGIETTLRSDIRILYVLAQWTEGQIDLGATSIRGIVEAFDRAVAAEVDFTNEARNAEAFAEVLDGIDGVGVPGVHRRLSARRVLCLDWIEGSKLSAIGESGADRQRVMERLVEASYQQIFVSGLFHADPHPGNLVVNDDSQLFFLDFGLLGRISPEMRDTLAQLFVGVVFRDAASIARTIYRAASTRGRVQLRELSAEIEILLQRYGDTRLDEQDTSRIVEDLIRLARRHNLGLPDEYAVLARTEVTLDGVARGLIPDWDIWEALKPYAARIAAERMDPQRLGSEVLQTGISAVGLLKGLPSQLDQLLIDLERGSFELTAQTPAVDRLTKTLDRLGRAVIFGLGVSAFLISSAILVGVIVLRQSAQGTVGFSELSLSFAVVLSLLAASTLVGGLMWNLFVRERFESLRWSRLLRLLPGFRSPPPS